MIRIALNELQQFNQLLTRPRVFFFFFFFFAVVCFKVTTVIDSCPESDTHDCGTMRWWSTKFERRKKKKKKLRHRGVSPYVMQRYKLKAQITIAYHRRSSMQCAKQCFCGSIHTAHNHGEFQSAELRML